MNKNSKLIQFDEKITEILVSSSATFELFNSLIETITEDEEATQIVDVNEFVFSHVDAEDAIYHKGFDTYRKSIINERMSDYFEYRSPSGKSPKVFIINRALDPKIVYSHLSVIASYVIKKLPDVAKSSDNF